MLNANYEAHVVHPYASSLFDEPATYHDCDLSANALKPVLVKVKPDLVISTVRGGSFGTQKQIIDCAIAAGIKRFIPSEFGQDSLNEKIQERLPPSRERARTIEYLTRASKAGEISWVAVATGVDLERGLLNGNLGFDLKWQSVTLHGTGHERFAASSSMWIGRVIIAVIQHWQAVENQYLYAAGMTTTADDIVAEIEKNTGKSFEVGRGEVDECVREAQKRIEQGFPDAGMFLYGRSIMYDDSLGAVRPFEENDAKDKIGLKSEKLEDVIKKVVHEHNHHGGGVDCGCD